MRLRLNLPRGLDAAGVPISPTPHLLPHGKHSPNAPGPFPLRTPLPFLCYSFGFTLPFSACLRRQPAQWLFVNKLSINIRFGGKNSEFCRQAAGAGEAGCSPAAGGAGDVWGESRAAGSPRDPGHEEGAAKGFWAWRAAWPPEGWQRPPRDGRVPQTQRRDMLLCDPCPLERVSHAGVFPIPGNFAESNGAFCCCCFSLSPSQFFFCFFFVN